MKRILNLINTAAATAITTLEGVINDLRLEGDAPEQWQRLVEYGEYPAKSKVNGREVEVVQVMDRQAGELMVENHRTVINAIRHLGRGLPIYVGHPDNADWLKSNPGADESAKGRIKGLEAREDGVWMLAAVNDDGRKLIGGDAPAYSAQSPNWDMVPVSPGSNRYRPYVLRSIGLTNKPNISSCVIGLNMAGATDISPTAAEVAEAPENQDTDDDMKLTAQALAALGFAPDAEPTPEELSAAIVKMLGEKTAVETDKVEMETNLTAANARVTTLESELGSLRTTISATAINTAVTEGRITEADRGTWEGLLKADPVNGASALAKLGKATGLNTESQLGNLGDRKSEGPPAAAGTIQAINTAVADYAKANGLDLKKTADYDAAYAGTKAAKPELFTPAKKA